MLSCISPEVVLGHELVRFLQNNSINLVDNFGELGEKLSLDLAKRIVA